MVAEDKDQQVSFESFLMSEDNLARRVAWEMDRRGWSQERMAKEMTDAGYPIHQTSVGKIINPGQGKRRSISVDDALGFAKVFGLPIEQLLVPIEAVIDERLFSIFMRIVELNRERAAIDIEAMELVTEFVYLMTELGEEDLQKVMSGARWEGSGPVVEELRRWGKSLMEAVKSPEMQGKTVREVVALLREGHARLWQRMEGP